MGNQGSKSNKKKEIASNTSQREPQVTFQLPQNNSRIETDSRRRAIRQQMTDNAKSIELHAVKLGRIVSNPNWRHSKELQHTLPHIRDIVYGVDNELYSLIDASARVSLQRSDPAYHGKFYIIKLILRRF
jgi:predicted 2-oxoglutarate/Fe(II)-dependent dioxygenase YbiX